MRTRITPSHPRTDGRFNRYRRRREQAIQQARFEGATLGLAFAVIPLMLALAHWSHA